MGTAQGANEHVHGCQARDDQDSAHRCVALSPVPSKALPRRPDLGRRQVVRQPIEGQHPLGRLVDLPQSYPKAHGPGSAGGAKDDGSNDEQRIQRHRPVSLLVLAHL